MKTDRMRRAAVYLGLCDEDATEQPSTGLELLGPSLLVTGTTALSLAIIMGAVVLVLFERGWGRLAAGTGIGILIWGCVLYFSVVRGQLPGGALQTAPPGASWERSERGLVERAPGLLLGLAVLTGLAWLVEQWDLSSMFVPGQLGGFAAAWLLGGWRVRRWEHQHRSRVAVRFDEGKQQLFAVSPPDLPNASPPPSHA